MTLSNPSFRQEPVGIGSTLALAAAIRRTHKRVELPSSMRALLRHNPVAPMYQIAPRVAAGTSEATTEHQQIQREAHSAANTLMAIAERLRRLRAAYGAWRHFDACAYFDLTVPQTERLVQIYERVTMVHVLFFVDALLPSFQKAESFWQEDFRPHYLALRAHLRNSSDPLEPVMLFAEHSQPQMSEHWQRVIAVIRATRALLDNEIGFWATNGSSDERARWRWAWGVDPAAGICAELLPALGQTPTLTLAVDFPLPTYRQPGRRRRLTERHERGDDRHRSG